MKIFYYILEQRFYVLEKIITFIYKSLKSCLVYKPLRVFAEFVEDQQRGQRNSVTELNRVVGSPFLRQAVTAVCMCVFTCDIRGAFQLVSVPLSADAILIKCMLTAWNPRHTLRLIPFLLRQFTQSKTLSF